MISKDQIVSSSFVRYGALPLGLIALVVVLRVFFFTPFRVMTTAQAPALRLGAWALARRTQSPDRGSLILFHTERAGTSTSAQSLMVARVVALPGDSLEVRSGQLFVNGVAVSDYRHPRDTREQYALRLPREGGVYPLTSTNLVAYRAALVEEQRLFAPARGEVALHRLAPKDWLVALASNPYHTFDGITTGYSPTIRALHLTLAIWVSSLRMLSRVLSSLLYDGEPTYATPRYGLRAPCQLFREAL